MGKPNKPIPLKTYPDEVLENIYIDNWSFVYNSTTGEYVREEESYNTVKDFLNKSFGRFKKRFSLQAQTGFNFSLSDDDGSITFYNGETYTFKYMYENGIPVGDKPPYNEPDSYRQRTYPDAKKFIFLKGNEFSDNVDEFIVIRSYDKETIDIDLLGRNNNYPLIEMKLEGAFSTDYPPFDSVNVNRIAGISCHALIPVETPLKNDAFSTYILSGEQMNNLRDNMVIYNDMVINTYNYPIPFNPDSLLDADMKIGTADTNIPVKEFKQIQNEIQIFEFTIPELPDVNLVTLFPIFKEGITLTYDIIRGKVIKGISVYDCLSNTNYLKIYADDVLIDYVSYNIQTQIPINWDNVKFENKGSIGQRIPYFKSYIIIQYDKLEQVTEVTKGYIRGSVENLDSLILKDEISIMDSLFKGGVFIDRNIGEPSIPVEPSIPTDGLVCYLDTQGKTNTDTDREMLVDLSGNGNHGILQNFNFTEESGYVKDLSGGVSGLRFDGVDDQIQLNLTLTDYTIIADGMMHFAEGKRNTFLETDGITLYINHRTKELLANILKPDGTRTFPLVLHERMGKICIKVSGEILEIKTGTQIINEAIKNGTTFLRIGRGQVNFRKCLIYNRALTDTEIQQLMEVE